MTESRTLLITCDTPGCTAHIEIPVRENHWLSQPWQEAINEGWDVDKDDGPDFCPIHHSWMPVPL